jgi:hypothetical protein
VTSKRTLIIAILIVVFLYSGSAISIQPATRTHPLDTNFHSSSSDYSYLAEECTSVIVTGSAAKDGRAILMKNRDSSDMLNRPFYYAATESTYAFVAVNTYWMGINERGLAVMNTAMLALAESPNAGEFNGVLNRMILELCENVSQVATMLGDPESPIGPTERTSWLAVCTCVGVVDRNGAGAFFEISNSMFSVEYVVDGYQSRANHPRTFPGLASGPNGRDQYALDALEEISTEKGVIAWEDVAQEVSRCVRDKEEGSIDFRINGEVCNDNTVAAMVALSGDSRYDGKLNTMWCEYGCVPIIGVFFPSMVAAGNPPSILNTITSSTQVKLDYAEGSMDNYYNPSRVREIQEYSFAAEDYVASEYDELMDLIPDDLPENEIDRVLSEFVDITVRVTADMYINETSEIPDYAGISTISIPTSTTTTATTTTTVTSTTSTTGTTSTTTETTDTHPLDLSVPVFGVSAVATILVLGLILRRRGS